jgi:ATP-binding cassette subfamily B (MDR/TAP) protein 1
MIAGASIGHIAPHFGAFAAATASGQKIFHIIDRKSPLDPESERGEIPASLDGEIVFRNVQHVYPSRPDKIVLDDLNLVIHPGKLIAVVGISGSGKSTLVALLERFYLPVCGEILLDGRPLGELNLRWLRRQIALVSQEPVLFNTTVYENIRFGLIGTQFEHVSPISLLLLKKRVQNADGVSSTTHVGIRGEDTWSH